ncbi:MAG: hypothetical protein ACT4UP_06185 [Gammaproteobacteria bacterium]
MYESRHQPPLHRAGFLRRVLGHAAVAVGLFAVSIAIGMAGYIGFERLSWLDAFLDTCMLLGGMGPIHVPQTGGGKIFAAIFALYAGIVFIAVAAIVLAPVAHRLLHRFQWSRTPQDARD